MPARQRATSRNCRYGNLIEVCLEWQASNAVDGNLGTTSHAFNGVNSSVPAWWQVDLRYETIIYSVTTYAPSFGQ